ncbi:MAG: hypothetical protein BGO25_02205 [Acidobacteriales bacterium 59-55]|nr:MAG: hypothetical protein ABT04_02430 [Granulicella sp. SCN 62-9]OJV42343.1 MAG: hypothetical protein BGO25_02205 [Acidobacteriales bacterium 59-55]
MTESRPWRNRVFSISVALAVLNPIYFFIAINLASRFSDKVWGNFIVVGVLVGLLSLACGLLGQGHRRWMLILVTCVETILWWFMAVSL